MLSAGASAADGPYWRTTMRKTTILGLALLAGLAFGTVWTATAEAG